MVATDEDRKLAAYIRTVFETCGEHGHERVVSCMASVIAGYKAGADVFCLANDILEHG